MVVGYYPCSMVGYYPCSMVGREVPGHGGKRCTRACWERCTPGSMVGIVHPWYVPGIPWWVYTSLPTMHLPHPGYTTSLTVPLLSVHQLPLTPRCEERRPWAQS